MRMKTLIGGAALALSLSACAFGDEKLTLAYDAETAKPGMLADAPSTRIDVAEVTNARQDRKPVGKAKTADPKRPILVGYKRNGFGQDTGNIVATKPVAEIVEDALETMLTVNGHTVTDDASVVLDTTLKDFWFDYKTGMMTVEFFANVEAEVALKDRATGEVLFEDSFVGSEASKQAGGLSGTWTKVMNGALADMMRQISLSDDLVEAIEEAEAGAAPMMSDAARPVRTGS